MNSRAGTGESGFALNAGRSQTLVRGGWRVCLRTKREREQLADSLLALICGFLLWFAIYEEPSRRSCSAKHSDHCSQQREAAGGSSDRLEFERSS